LKASAETEIRDFGGKEQSAILSFRTDLEAAGCLFLCFALIETFYGEDDVYSIGKNTSTKK
jgi:hypothetical protein